LESAKGKASNARPPSECLGNWAILNKLLQICTGID
jgi:hypothetical protein